MVHTYYDPYSGYPLHTPFVYIPATTIYTEIVDQKPNGNPTAHVTVGKSRKKLYSKNGVQTVFLKDEEEFELELFNPTRFTVGAQIFLNGEAISERKYILRPGQRAFIERHIDTPAKLKFSTYEVEAGDAQVDAAIKENGAVEVKFFKQYVAPVYHAVARPTLYGSGMKSRSFKSMNLNDQVLGSTYTASYNSSADTSDTVFSMFSQSVPRTTITETDRSFMDASMDSLCEVPSTKETGRIEEGSRSDQSFSEVAMTFEYNAFASTKLKMEPISAQPVDEIRVYCTECGRKQKPGEKFCPTCGKKFD